jgi:hypothetical protein
MPIDVEGARKAGYTEEEIANSAAEKFNFNISAARQSGWGNPEIIEYLQNKTPEKYKPDVPGWAEKYPSAYGALGAAKGVYEQAVAPLPCQSFA